MPSTSQTVGPLTLRILYDWKALDKGIVHAMLCMHAMCTACHCAIFGRMEEKLWNLE